MLVAPSTRCLPSWATDPATPDNLNATVQPMANRSGLRIITRVCGIGAGMPVVSTNGAISFQTEALP